MKEKWKWLQYNIAILQFTPTVRSAFLSSVSMSEDAQLSRLIRLPVVRHQFQWLFPIPRFRFSLKPSWWGSNSPLCYSKKLYNKIKRELYATDCECFELKQFYTANRLPCFGCQMLKNWPSKLGRMYQTVHQNDGFNALWLYCSNI